jgi:hypothetical protein
MRNFGVFGSFWPLNGSAVWTIVNRNEYDVAGQQLSVPFQEGYHYFDLYHGTELTGSRDGDKVVLSFPTEARGFGAVWSTRVNPDARMSQLMKALERMSQRPLAEFDAEWKPLDQQIVPIPSTKPSPVAPEGMVEVPSGDFDFVAQGTEIEGDDAIGVDVAYPWESSARRFHRHRVHLDRFYIDKYPVNNAQYKSFFEASHYRPKDPANFLKTGVMVRTLEDGRINPLHGFRWRTHARTPLGRANDCRTNGSGNMRPKAPMAVCIRGAASGESKQFPSRIRGVHSGDPMTPQSIRQAPARLV